MDTETYPDSDTSCASMYTLDLKKGKGKKKELGIIKRNTPYRDTRDPICQNEYSYAEDTEPVTRIQQRRVKSTRLLRVGDTVVEKLHRKDRNQEMYLSKQASKQANFLSVRQQ